MIIWRSTNNEEISNLIDIIDNSKSSLIEGIDSSLLKDCLICTIVQACTLFNHIFANGIFPEAWENSPNYLHIQV